jgi:hypothetical protein
MFILQLKDYAAKDRGRRIINVNDWTRRYIDLPNNLANYPPMLVDLFRQGRALVSSASMTSATRHEFRDGHHIGTGVLSDR